MINVLVILVLPTIYNKLLFVFVIVVGFDAIIVLPLKIVLLLVKFKIVK